MNRPDDAATAASIIDEARADARRRYPHFVAGEPGITRAVEAMLTSVDRVLAVAADPFATPVDDVRQHLASGGET